MKTIGIFEAKTKLSDICNEVARTHLPVIITRRGAALVRIEPMVQQKMTIRERRVIYQAAHGAEEPDDARDFDPAPRSRDHLTFRIEE